ncbi:hypothetical protein [Tenacibaculum sp. 190524A05c]|uniref:Uncharacterized protein n=1 Tax=Tenacibaculum platacis TaxID=3137852 RepID=A0ABP1EHY4_9FLAO
MKKSKEVLKTYFETGDKPTEQQYGDLIDSYIDSKQDVGESNRRFVIDENGEVSVASGIEVTQADWNQTDSSKADFIKNKPGLNSGLPKEFYDEGVWTPEARFNNTKLDTTVSVGTYTRIGNIVHFRFYLQNIDGQFNNITLPFDAVTSDINIIHAEEIFEQVGGSGGNIYDFTEPRELIIAVNKLRIKNMVTNMFLNIAVPGNKTDLQISGTFKTNVYGASAVS